jgi:hypothetical protein
MCNQSKDGQICNEMRHCGLTVSRAWISNQEKCLWEDKIIPLDSNLNALGSPSELCEMDRNRMAPEAQPDAIDAGKAIGVCLNISRQTRSKAAINNVDFHSHWNQKYPSLRCILRWQTLISDAMLVIPTVEIKPFNAIHGPLLCHKSSASTDFLLEWTTFKCAIDR